MQSDLLQRLFNQHEEIIKERKEEMQIIKEWMGTLKDDLKLLINAVQMMVDVLGEKLPHAANKTSQLSNFQLPNSDCKYAGVYFVHN